MPTWGTTSKDCIALEQLPNVRLFKPVTNIDDIFAIHLMLLYELSILARYRPAVWRRILESNLDGYRSLLIGYNDGNYPPPHWSEVLLSYQQLTPISSRWCVYSNCGRDASRAASREAVLVVSSAALLT